MSTHRHVQFIQSGDLRSYTHTTPKLENANRINEQRDSLSVLRVRICRCIVYINENDSSLFYYQFHPFCCRYVSDRLVDKCVSVSACVVTVAEQHILLWIFELLKLDMIVMTIIICDCDVVVVASLIIWCSVGVAAGQTYCTEWLHCWRRHHAFLRGCVDVVLFTSSSSQSPLSGCRIEAAHFIFTMQ